MPVAKDPALVRAFAVRTPFAVFLPIGFRPSRVFLDESRRPTLSRCDERLNEPVYERRDARPGEQVHERTGPAVLIAADGGWWPVAVAPPMPLELDFAFTHAVRQIEADRLRLEELLAAGQIEVTSKPRRVRGSSSRGPQRRYAAEDPIIIPARGGG